MLSEPIINDSQIYFRKTGYQNAQKGTFKYNEKE